MCTHLHFQTISQIFISIGYIPIQFINILGHASRDVECLGPGERLGCQHKSAAFQRYFWIGRTRPTSMVVSIAVSMSTLESQNIATRRSRRRCSTLKTSLPISQFTALGYVVSSSIRTTEIQWKRYKMLSEMCY